MGHAPHAGERTEMRLRMPTSTPKRTALPRQRRKDSAFNLQDRALHRIQTGDMPVTFRQNPAGTILVAKTTSLKRATVRITQTNQSEIGPCAWQERGRSSVAIIFLNTCCFIPALLAVMVGMP